MNLFGRLVVSYGKLSVMELPVYLAEFEFCFNNRDDLYLLRDNLVRLPDASRLTYASLTEGKARS